MTDITAPNGNLASKLCFGAMQFGGTADDAASRQMYADCRDAGVNFFDTAHVYTEGRSEKMLGEYVGAEREAVIVASNLAYTGGSGRETIETQFALSQRRLGLDVIDVLYLHRWDPATPLEQTLEALARLKDSGKIRYIGVSNFAAWQVMKARAVAKSFGMSIDILQPMYSLVKRQAEVELFPMARSEGMSVASYSPLASGLLTGKYSQGGKGRLATDDRYAARYGQEWMHVAATAFAALAADMGQHPVTLAVAWTAHHTAVTAPIISARSAAQLAPSLDAINLRLSAPQYDEISGLSPKPAPATDRLEEA